MTKTIGTRRWDATAGVLVTTAVAGCIAFYGGTTLFAWFDSATWMVWRGGW